LNFFKIYEIIYTQMEILKYLRKDSRFRQKIHKKIFLDNLRIMGKQPYQTLKKKPITYKGISPILLTLIIILLGYTVYHNYITLQGEKTLVSSVIESNNSEVHSQIQAPHVQRDSLKFLSSMVNPEISIAKVFGLKVKRIMIDPGHGGSDPGTSGIIGTKEKNVALDIAKRLKSRLERYNYEVIMTRQEDEAVSLQKRVELANSSMADLFISIHLNYLPTRPANIIETYYFGLSFDEEVLKLAEKENTDSPYGHSEFKKILEKVNSTMKYEESYRLADSIQRSLFTNIKRIDSEVMDFGIKRAPFVVLLGVEMPSVLVEVSCLSNKVEELRLNTWNYREKIAHYIEIGILNYLRNKGALTHEAKRTEEG
jgi:N-acetylmuramoyl-L-alanine amidase